MQTRIFLPAVAGILALTSSPTPAAEAWEDEPVVVTATRTERQAGRVPARMTVIDRDEIERSQAPDLLELLRLKAGIDVARAGGPGAQTSVFLRGTNSNHVLVLIDGVRAPASGTGAFTWEILDPALIERIEIVRGPRAARWGSDAIGGVIQIFTRRAEGPSASLGAGSDGDRSASAAWGGGGAGEIGFAAAARHVDGFSAQNPNGFAFDPDDDGYENLGAVAGGRFAGAAGTFDWRARVATGEVEFDQGTSDFENGSLRAEWLAETSGPWDWSAGFGLLSDDLETASAFGISRVETLRLQVDALAERRLGEDAMLLLGVDAWNESGEARGQWDEERFNVGLFAGLEGGLGRTRYEASLRADEDENFGTEVTGSLGLGLDVGETWRLFANGGRSFHAPTFSQLYSPGFGGLFAGNPDLEPERAWSAEVGGDFFPSAGHRFLFSAYSTWIEDLIQFAGTDFRAINVAEARIRGFELGHDWRSGNWFSELRATWQDAEDRETGRDLLRRAERKASGVFGYTFEAGHRLDAEVVHVGERPDVGGVMLPSYTLFNLRADLELAEDWHAELRVDNLADKDYEPLFGFNASDRRFLVALAWRR